MKEISGTSLEDYPFPGLTWVRDLEYFEGPLLAEYRSETNDRYLFYWVDCDKKTNRWMVLRVSESDILRLAAQTVPLDLVIPEACRDSHVFFVDFDHDRTPLKVRVTPISKIPDSYVPAEGAYLSRIAESGPNTFSVLLDDDLSIRSLSDLPRIVSQTYAMMYALEVLKPSRLTSYPWRGGFSAMHFYRWILDSLLPPKARPEIRQWQYASPGFIEFEMDSKVAGKMASLANKISSGDRKPRDAYRELYAYIRKNKLNSLSKASPEWSNHNHELTRLSRELLKTLGLTHPDDLIQAAPRPFEAAKIALSFAKRLQSLAKFQEAGMITLPA